MLTNDDYRRVLYCEKLIKKYNLDLSGLKIFTEMASGNYMFIPALIGLAGGEAFAYRPDLTNNEVDEINAKVDEFTEDFKSKVVCNKNFMSECDIITNSGYVRPITKEDIDHMKSSAVIALMMSADQVRKEDIDISACCNRNIPLVDTDEKSTGILSSIAFKTMKVLFEAGLSVWNDNYLLLSTGILSTYYEMGFGKMGISYSKAVNAPLDAFDAIIVADHIDHSGYTLIGDSHSLIPIEYIKKQNPLIKIINICGKIDVQGLLAAGIDVYPTTQPKQGHTTISGDYLSYKVTLELVCASLKAAEQVARIRIAMEETNKLTTGAI